MIAGTIGPVASAFSICALVSPWRQHLLPGQQPDQAQYIPDPAWYVCHPAHNDDGDRLLTMYITGSQQ